MSFSVQCCLRAQRSQPSSIAFWPCPSCSDSLNSLRIIPKLLHYLPAQFRRVEKPCPSLLQEGKKNFWDALIPPNLIKCEQWDEILSHLFQSSSATVPTFFFKCRHQTKHIFHKTTDVFNFTIVYVFAMLFSIKYAFCFVFFKSSHFYSISILHSVPPFFWKNGFRFLHCFYSQFFSRTPGYTEDNTH